MGRCLGSYFTCCLYRRGDDQSRGDEMGGTHGVHYEENKLMKITIKKPEDKTPLAIKT